MAYCGVDNLLTGDIPLPMGVSPQQNINSAADEIDAALGQLYITPIEIDPLDPAVRPSILVLKGVNAKLASGRIIMAADAGGQDNSLHAYGLSLIREARGTLIQLRSSSDSLPGAALLPVVQGVNVGKGPIILNRDPKSLVDGFYDFYNPANG